jgi:transposase
LKMNTSADRNVDGSLVRGVPRFSRPERLQVEMRFLALEQLLPADHRARAVWQFVESLDLSPFYAQIKAVEGGVGRTPVDPRLLMSMWMLATLEGISSARKLAELSTRDMAYLWICGGVGVNHHLLSDFRTDHVHFLDQLLTDSVAALLHQNLVTLDRVAQDGMRVRAHAGTSSFRRRASLEDCQKQAREQVELLRRESEAEDKSSGDRRTKAARQRAAEEKEERIQKALRELKELQVRKEQRKKGEGENARVSTTDPEARKMKMADGGFRPGYNVQFATTCEGRVIVGGGRAQRRRRCRPDETDGRTDRETLSATAA